MKSISFIDILSYLDNNSISYKVLNENKIQDNYNVASLFCPINGGVYYFNGNTFEYIINNSLILTNKPLHSSENTILIIEKLNVQLVYYKLLAHYFSKKSTGIIDYLTKVDPKANIGENVQIDAFSVIEHCTIGNNVIIGSNCKIYENVVIEDNVIIESGSIIGTSGIAWAWNENQTDKIIQPQLGGVLIKERAILSANTILVRGSLNENTTIGSFSHLAPGCRLGHGTKVGDHTHLANAVITGGNTEIGDYCFIGSNAVFRPKIKVDNSTVVGAGSVVVKNTTCSGMTLMGVPAKESITKESLSGMPKPKL